VKNTEISRNQTRETIKLKIQNKRQLHEIRRHTLEDNMNLYETKGESRCSGRV